MKTIEKLCLGGMLVGLVGAGTGYFLENEDLLLFGSGFSSMATINYIFYGGLQKLKRYGEEKENVLRI